MNIRKTIQATIEHKEYSIRQVSRITGVSHTTITSFLNGKKITLELFIKLINGLDFPIEKEKSLIENYELEIFGKKSKRTIFTSKEIKSMQARISELEQSQEAGNFDQKIPIYSCVSAGCGYIPDAVPIDWMSINSNRHITGVVVKGDSMEPTIKNNAIVFFEKDTTVSDGDIGIFILDDESFVKRIYRTKDSIILESDNRDYRPILIQMYEDLKICGKVIKILNDA